MRFPLKYDKNIIEDEIQNDFSKIWWENFGLL